MNPDDDTTTPADDDLGDGDHLEPDDVIDDETVTDEPDGTEQARPGANPDEPELAPGEEQAAPGENPDEVVEEGAEQAFGR